MTIQQIHYIIAISETGSLNKAAEILYVSQPSLSGAVHDLEEELGIKIFHRSSKGVSLTNEGAELIVYARQLYQQYEVLMDKYGKGGEHKKKFGISTQHYSFAVKTFVEMVKRFGTQEYDFAIRETKTREVIDDVATLRSEIGIIYLSSFNNSVIKKILKTNGLSFHKLIDCKTYVYVWNGHPLAKNEVITHKDLHDYPCLSFEQGGNSSFYFAEEIYSTNEYPQMIKVNDRATMLNLMVGLNGYTLCSGIICEELNGSDFSAVPYSDENDPEGIMRIGYIVRKDQIMSDMANMYINEMTDYLSKCVQIENTDK